MTMVELLISVCVILIITASASIAFMKLLRGFKSQSKISETYVENLCGLELLRYDIEMAGYGLPADMSGINNYNEAAQVVTAGVVDPASLNDAPAGLPRAFVLVPNGQNNADVLAVKSSVAMLNGTTAKWSFIYFDSTLNLPRVYRWNEPTLDFSAGERFIIVDQGGQNIQRNLLGNWSFNFSSAYYNNANAIPSPTNNSQIFLAYGIDDIAPRMPFNRVDYYLARPGTGFPARCAQTSFVLYRSTINHTDGQRSIQPLIDCVRDFQVAFGLDTNGNGNVDNWTANMNLSASNVRAQVRELRVFILHHEGQTDREYQTSGAIILGDADTGALSVFNPNAANNELNFRWKVVKLTAKPMNLF